MYRRISKLRTLNTEYRRYLKSKFVLQTHGKAKYHRRRETKHRTKTMKMGLKSVTSHSDPSTYLPSTSHIQSFFLSYLYLWRKWTNGMLFNNHSLPLEGFVIPRWQRSNRIIPLGWIHVATQIRREDSYLDPTLGQPHNCNLRIINSMFPKWFCLELHKAWWSWFQLAWTRGHTD